MAYQHIAELGGLRGRQRYAPSAANAFWQNKSFHNYADYAESEPFQRGLGRLRALARGRACAIMCAESVWWRCHRRIIADYLLAAGERVFRHHGAGAGTASGYDRRGASGQPRHSDLSGEHGRCFARSGPMKLSALR